MRLRLLGDRDELVFREQVDGGAAKSYLTVALHV